ncbi:MAG: hypothetical protein WCF23_16185 [Candidatus Nitrosopolaris sp.]
METDVAFSCDRSTAMRKHVEPEILDLPMEMSHMHQIIRTLLTFINYALTTKTFNYAIGIVKPN